MEKHNDINYEESVNMSLPMSLSAEEAEVVVIVVVVVVVVDVCALAKPNKARCTRRKHDSLRRRTRAIMFRGNSLITSSMSSSSSSLQKLRSCALKMENKAKCYSSSCCLNIKQLDMAFESEKREIKTKSNLMLIRCGHKDTQRLSAPSAKVVVVDFSCRS